jgi:ABC-type transport system involved in cytochrome bd biosynthesis fused ATPase/permease subunit
MLTLLGFLEHTGTIEIDGVSVASVPKPLLRARVTTLSQDAVQMAGSVRENLLPYIGQAQDSRTDDTTVLKALSRVGLSEVISRNGGLDMALSDMGLSEGEMQFLCLARAILHNQWTKGKLVLMDEPTSNMDHETDARIQTLVGEAFADCTIIMVSHRPEAVAEVDVHLEVLNGKVRDRSEEVSYRADEE